MAWRRLDSTARLDAEGTLHVVERQEIVFNGDWNGGERNFNVRPWQRLRLEGLVHLAPDGREVALARGELGAVDHDDLPQRHVLRWRSRAPSDPPFAMTTLVCVLEYALETALSRQADDRYLLAHDFAFPDRRWVIGRASATLALAPAWEAEPGAPLNREGGPLLPGQGFGLTVPLHRLDDAGPLRLPNDPLPAAVRLAVAAAFALLLGAAAWDDAVGAPEVAAVLARMASEGKISTRLVAAAREWLAQERARPAPRLDDRWVPYLIALELGPDLDRWTRVHGAVGAAGHAAGTGGGFSGGGSGGW